MTSKYFPVHFQRRIKLLINSETKKELFYRAVERFGVISPISGPETDSEGFCELYGYVAFWFNDEAGSTHLVREKIVCQ
jgi:hypothetical protein